MLWLDCNNVSYAILLSLADSEARQDCHVSPIPILHNHKIFVNREITVPVTPGQCTQNPDHHEVHDIHTIEQSLAILQACRFSSCGCATAHLSDHSITNLCARSTG